jgi:hypothetical protein
MSRPHSKPTVEKRRSPLRNQVQAWFEALQRHFSELDGADAIATLIKGWTKPEDIMRAYPALVPLFLDIVWRSRKTAGFMDLLRTEAGEVAEKPTDILALSQKCFDEIVISHLLGTVRLTCERLQKEWVAAEREKRRSAISRTPVLGALLRGLGFISPIKTEILLADYPQKGLYEALKPYLSRRAQFALVEALTALPTRTVSVLGAVVGALDDSALIRKVAGLNRADLKIAVEMAETFVEAVKAPAKDPADIATQVAAALSDMLGAGPSFVVVASANRQLAKDAIVKFAPVMKAEIWTIFGDAESLRRIAECPAVVVETLGALAIEMNQRVSMILAELTADRLAAAHAMKSMRDNTNPATFLSWIKTETYLVAWKQFVAHLNRDTGAPRAEGVLLGPQKAAIKIVCERSARVFAEIDAPQKQAA